MSYVRDNIDAMQGYTPGFQPKDPDFIKLNTNENPYPPSPHVLKAMEEACEKSIRKYPPPLGDPFREKAGDVFGIDPDCIICGFGSDDILTITVRTFCGEGQTIAYPSPTYSLYPVLAQIQGARTETTEFPEDYSLPENLARIDAELTFLANPNAPSGTLIPPDRVETLANELNGVLAIDEAYVDFADDNCLELTKTCENIVVTRTMSKSYSLAGLRFGYAVAPRPLAEAMLKVKDSYNVSAPGVAGARAAIADQKWLGKNIARIRKTRARLTEKLRELGFFCWDSQSNFVLARVPEGQNGKELFEALFENKILVRYFDLPRIDDCLRITVGTDKEIDVLLKTLKAIL